MSIVIKEIMNLIDPVTIDKEIVMPNMMIRENYVQETVPQNYDEFMAEVAKYYQYHHSRWVNCCPVILPAEYAYAGAEVILNKKFPLGIVAVVEDSIRSREGGILYVLDAISNGIIDLGIDLFIHQVKTTKINILDYDDVIDFSRQYLNKYTKVFLGDDHITETILAARIMMENTLDFHAKWVKEYRGQIS